MDESVAPLISGFGDKEPASEEAIRLFAEQSGLFLPRQYIQFLKKSNGGEGFVGQKSAYLILWGVDELLEMNKAYRVEECAPNVLLFGSSGAGEAYGFDVYMQMEVVKVPFVGMSPDRTESVAPTFNEFLEFLAKSEPLAGAADAGPDPIDRGKEIFEIQPVLLGGSPTDLKNKALLTREQHIEAVNYWNKLIREQNSTAGAPPCSEL